MKNIGMRFTKQKKFLFGRKISVCMLTNDTQ